jgi:hypothetical protein
MTPYRDSLRFDSIIVIESLRSEDMKTGEWLYYRVLDSWAQRNAPFYTKLYQPASRAEFLGVLDEVRDCLFRNGHRPILHIEAHGSSDGLQLGSDEEVRWEDLRDRFTEMNESSAINLLVVMAMCAGWHLSRLLLPMHRAPVWGVVGPIDDRVQTGDLREAMESFYRVLLSSFDARTALAAMNQHVPYESWQYLLETAETMFCRVFHHYIKDLCTEDQLQARENEIVSEVVRRQQGNLLVAFDARERARLMLRDHAAMFAFYRRIFFMIDEHPEGDTRFRLTYEDCANLPEVVT